MQVLASNYIIETKVIFLEFVTFQVRKRNSENSTRKSEQKKEKDFVVFVPLVLFPFTYHHSLLFIVYWLCNGCIIHFACLAPRQSREARGSWINTVRGEV